MGSEMCIRDSVMGGLFVGAMLPFLFSSMAMKAVGSAAADMITEVRRQFREIAGLKEGKEGVKPDVETCIAISTQASIREMVAPGLLAVITPVVVGFAFGPEALGGLLAGVTSSGVLMAIFMSNAGGAWDNAKKSFEGDGYQIPNGELLKKGTPSHAASVVGDTVGDPFKDTAGPSLNILVKLMSVVALVIAPLIANAQGDSCCDDTKASVTAKKDCCAEMKAAGKSCDDCDSSEEKKAEAKPEVKAEAKPEVKAEAKPEVKAEAKPEVKAEAKSAEK